MDISEKQTIFAASKNQTNQNMQLDFKEIDELTGSKARVYSVVLDDEEETLLEQFFNENADNEDDLNKVIYKIKTMANYTGCRRSFFKEGEGAWADGMVALKSTGTLRLYGMYFNETVILFGSGGNKPPGIRAYQDYPPLNAKAQQMREIVKEINKRISNGELKINDDGTLT